MHQFRTCLYFCHASFDPDRRAAMNSLFFFEHKRLSSYAIRHFGLLEQRRTSDLEQTVELFDSICHTRHARHMSMFVVPWMAVKRGAWLRALSMPGQSAREKPSMGISDGQGFVHGSVVSAVTLQWSVTLTSLTRLGRVVAYRSIVLLLSKSLEKRVGSFTHCERPKSSNN